MQCTNTMGPHDQMVRICACGMAYYCSGSCQRMHWHEHREECLENNGPWDLNGEISISDVVFTGDIVSWYISDHKDEIGHQLSKLNLLPKYRGGQPRQAVLHVDLTDLIPPLPTHQINIQTKPASVPGVVMVEVCLRLGNLRATRWMPFIMPLFYFGL
ncbi:hypothetical protein K523DRAFT_228230 [Schizophyllum commune Tattone D]|nr:hypothetical protein K525DRAFT_209012 [Schizophyllum commune Loenen D]KAI5835367.1 hypothetical protein K523DRAFT_228230 [Schizophyllum commune Tattone D]